MPYKCDICQKSFRYKVSQRTHKCISNANTNTEIAANSESAESTQQISENFIKAFLESSSVQQQQQQHSPASVEIANINANSTNFNEVMLTQAIDQIVVDSCRKLGLDDNKQQNMTTNLPLSNYINSQNTHDESSNSPLHQFQNMRLYSPQLESSPQNEVENCSLSGYL